MPINLTSRQVRTIEWMLEQSEPQTLAGMAAQLRLSPRMVRSDLDPMARFLEPYEVTLQRRRGVGVWLEGSTAAMAAVRESFAALQDDEPLRVISPDDRARLAIFALLSAAPDWLTVESMRRQLEVSVTSARRDLARVEEWLQERGLFLARQPGVGMKVVGSETAVRRSLIKLFLEVVPAHSLSDVGSTPEWWRLPGISAGIRDFLQQIPLAASHAIVQANDSLRHLAEQGHPWLAADLAVTVFRIRSGRTVDLDAGTLRSLRDHPVWETAELTGVALAELTGGPLDDQEIGGITQHLLALVELSADSDAKPEEDSPLVAEAIEIAAEALHPGLAEDQELRRSLADHVARLRIRLRYGLPVHNPLLREVGERYPEAHEVAKRIALLIAERIGSTVSEDEAGFVTMYLSGAMERLRLRPRARAMVMCPAGVATAWILVSRIQAEFPELDLVDVVSAGSIDGKVDVEADVIISTVDIGPEVDGVPVVVVGALLPQEDIRRLARHL